MLRWLIDAQAIPALMWSMVGLSVITVAGAIFLLLARLLPTPVPGERWARELLEFGAEAAPMLGILGTVCGLSIGFGWVGDSGTDARQQMMAALRTALYSTAFGLVLSIGLLLVLLVVTRRQR